ncbi:hypothetical protein [Bosea massiliensis]|uniref:Terminase small subunit n=1 Tax=Bosea massiliensis TaxID=151419 RepID=A0ABW0P9E2_9HYPH
MAAFTNMSTRGVRDFVARRIFVPGSKKGLLKFVESIHRYHDHLRASAIGKAGGGERDTLTTERANLAKLQAQEVELRLARARGEYVPLSDVTDGWAKVAQIVRAQGLAQTSRIGAKVPHLTAHDRTEIATLNREMLEAIAEEVAALQVLGSAGGAEFTSDQPVKAKPKLTEVKIPTNRGRPQGVKDSKPRAKRRS